MPNFRFQLTLLIVKTTPWLNWIEQPPPNGLYLLPI